MIYEDLINLDVEVLQALLDYTVKDLKLVKFMVMIMNSILADFKKEKVIESWNILQVNNFSFMEKTFSFIFGGRE